MLCYVFWDGFWFDLKDIFGYIYDKILLFDEFRLELRVIE